MTVTDSRTEDSRRVVTGVYDAAARGDVEALLALMAEDLVTEEPAFLPYGGVYHGRQGLAGLFAKIGAVLDVEHMQLDYLVAQNDRVFAVVRIPDRRTGQNILLAEESTVVDGQVAHLRIYFHDTQSLIGAPRS